jgi:hypothetical protein
MFYFLLISPPKSVRHRTIIVIKVARFFCYEFRFDLVTQAFSFVVIKLLNLEIVKVRK